MAKAVNLGRLPHCKLKYLGLLWPLHSLRRFGG